MYYEEDPTENMNLFFKVDGGRVKKSEHFTNTQFIIYLHTYMDHILCMLQKRPETETATSAETNTT